MLVRHYVAQKLAAYYAQPSAAVVGSASRIDFRSLWGEWHWQRVYQKLYRRTSGQWLTPVELFQPYFSNILAHFIAHHSRTNQKIQIVEIGGGRGTNANCLLHALQTQAPDVYEQITQYTLIDNSPTLLELQQETVSQEYRDKMAFRHLDLLQVAEQPFSKDTEMSLLTPNLHSNDHNRNTTDTTTFVLALEVLDNLPHDKIRIRSGSQMIEQAEIHPQPDGTLEEVFVPLTDPLLQQLVTKFIGTQRRPVTWFPTVAYRLLQQILEQQPTTQLLLMDFDSLPHPDRLRNHHRNSTWAYGEPLVTDMDDMDHLCYLTPRDDQHCDILFPTDFRQLHRAAQTILSSSSSSSSSSQVTTAKQSQFLQAYGPAQVEATQSWLTGYTPLLHDFVNCSALTVTSTPSLVSSSTTW